MADTERSRAAAIALAPDNDAYGISAQDFRDIIVSLWPEERANADDFFTGPLTDYITTDLTVRGDIFSGTLAASTAASFGDPLTLNASSLWEPADAADLASQMCQAIAGSAIASGASGVMLRRGLAYGSADYSGYVIGSPIYLGSGGGVTQTKPTNIQVLGYLETTGKARIEPSWSIV